MSQPPNYEYDVFISYPHQEEHRLWVQEIFFNIFELYLTNDLGRPPKIFLDRKGIESGDAWPERLKRALAFSRLFLPVWSINYFYSDWCMAECSVMLYRESQLNYRTFENPRGLIQPVKLFDGKKYPPFAVKIEPLDCTEFNLIGPDYKKTSQYSELQKKIRGWTPTIAEGIENSPAWQEKWLSEDWLDEPIKQWVHDANFQFPKQPFRPPSLAVPPV